MQEKFDIIHGNPFKENEKSLRQARLWKTVQSKAKTKDKKAHSEDKTKYKISR